MEREVMVEQQKSQYQYQLEQQALARKAQLEQQ